MGAGLRLDQFKPDAGIPVASLNEKLRELRHCMPEQPEIVYWFGQVLADRLEQYEELTPKGVATVAGDELSKFMSNYFVDDGRTFRAQITETLKTKIPDIAAIICSE